MDSNSDYKLSMISLEDDFLNMKDSYSECRPSLHYRFYMQGSIVFVAKCSDLRFRTLLNFYPVRQLYTYNSKPFPIYRYRKWTCVCDSDDIFDCKRCFVVYVRQMIDNLRDSMFAWQPVFEGM